MNKAYPTIESGPDQGLYYLKDAAGRKMATLQTRPDGKLAVGGYTCTLLIKPEAANSIIVDFER